MQCKSCKNFTNSVVLSWSDGMCNGHNECKVNNNDLCSEYVYPEKPIDSLSIEERIDYRMEKYFDLTQILIDQQMVTMKYLYIVYGYTNKQFNSDAAISLTFDELNKIVLMAQLQGKNR